MATPTTLIGLLWAVHYGWRQELIAESAREIAESARELHRRLGRFVEPLAKVGRQLDSAVGAYNEAVGSFDSRVMPQVRRIEQAGAASDREVERARRRSRSRRGAIASQRRLEDRRPRSSCRARRAEPSARGCGRADRRRRAPSASSTSASATGTVAGSSSTSEEQQVEREREQRPSARRAAAGRRARRWPRAGRRARRRRTGRRSPSRAEPNTALCRRGSPAAGCAALSASLGRCSRSETTSAVSAIAIATIPAASQRGGVTAAEQRRRARRS